MSSSKMPLGFSGKYKQAAVDACWEWLAGKNAQGYGSVNQAAYGDQLAHRVVYKTCIAGIPDGLIVMHTCDNPGCVNPAHLLLGTRGQNNADRSAKGRNNSKLRQGEGNGRAKLTEADAVAIQCRRASGEILRIIADDYGISIAQVHRITNNQSWNKP